VEEITIRINKRRGEEGAKGGRKRLFPDGIRQEGCYLEPQQKIER
jgi:hypothetical protein